MSKTNETLVRILDEERNERINAETNLDLKDRLLETTRRDLNEVQEILERVSRDNRALALEASESRNRRLVDGDIRMRYERLIAQVFPLMTQWVVQPTFDSDPAYYRINKIPFIKEVREASGLGLKEAKDLVDNFLATLVAEEMFGSEGIDLNADHHDHGG